MLNDEKLHQSLLKQKSEEVTQIIDHIPTRFGLAVTLLVILLFLVIFGFGWVIKYPDVLKGKISISGKQSPVKLVSNVAGRIQFLLDTSRCVSAEQYIAVIKNAADPQDIQHLKKLINSIDIHHISYAKQRHFFPENLSAGELNNKYFSFLDSFYQYLDYYNDQPFILQKNILIKSLVSKQDLLEETLQQYRKEKEKFSYGRKLYQRDSILYLDKVITKTEFETSNVDIISKEQLYNVMQKEITTDKYQLDDIKSKIRQLSTDKNQKENQLYINLINSYNELNENIRQWEHRYVLMAPIKGRLDLLNFLKNDDFIEAGREVCVIIPNENNIIGQVQLPEQGAGKVKIGQDVIIKLDNYPYTQYGSINGKVKSMSTIANEQVYAINQKVNSYLITVSMPSGLKTNYGLRLDFHFEAKGTAEIITNDERLLERLFDNLKH